MNTTRTEEDTLAERLRQCYQFERKRLDRLLCRPDGYRVPECWRSRGRERKGATVFHKLARFCQCQKIDPIRYIQWCLDLNVVGFERPPEPPALLAMRKMFTYRADQPKVRARIEARVKQQERRVRSEYLYCKSFSPQREECFWATVLCGSREPFTPLFKYAFALSVNEPGLSKLIAHWDVDARFQYQYHPEAYEAGPIGRALPVGFPERAAEAYNALLDHES